MPKKRVLYICSLPIDIRALNFIDQISLLDALFGRKGVFRIVLADGLVVKSDEHIQIETLGEAGHILEY